jgi:hypothetical protein
LATVTLRVKLITRLDGEPVFVCLSLEAGAGRVKSFELEEGIMAGQALEARRFVRRTQLGPGEYRKNFRQVDADIIAAVTSREADAVTPLMSKIYLRLVNASARYWEREGVLRFEAEFSDETHKGAWDALCEVAGVASATARKALRWMHEQGVIGYFSGKNGVGIRIFLNRAASSIGTRAAGKKILEFTRASSVEPRASHVEAGFSDSFADLEVLETDLNPRAPKNGAGNVELVKTPTALPRRDPLTFRPAGAETIAAASAERLTELLLGTSGRASGSKAGDCRRPRESRSAKPSACCAATGSSAPKPRAGVQGRRSAAGVARRPRRGASRRRRSGSWPRLASRCLRYTGGPST